MADTPDESTVLAVLQAHEPYASVYATVCCNCGEWDGQSSSSGTYSDHVMAAIREVMLQPPAPVGCAPSPANEGDRRCLTHRVWWPEGPAVCPEAEHLARAGSRDG